VGAYGGGAYGGGYGGQYGGGVAVYGGGSGRAADVASLFVSADPVQVQVVASAAAAAAGGEERVGALRRAVDMVSRVMGGILASIFGR
jgi:hypothetical protein